MTDFAFLLGVLTGAAYVALLWREWASNERDMVDLEQRLASIKARAGECS